MKCYPTPCLEFLEGRNLLGTLGGTHLPAADVQSTLHFVPMKGTAVGVATLGEQSFDSSGNIIVPVMSVATGNISHLGVFDH